ncbi:hypothetical protein CSIM01_01646 [Colletotrichum simmondsii]|uniref:Uncharacterized protein n=1 Tax=Colletotrichum simmondsii TaxID=703756 RepID=A0A135TRS9_9PEZI|nr:hypothetical protein CSIM01_01646 [Colletotrichum simmondsii]
MDPKPSTDHPVSSKLKSQQFLMTLVVNLSSWVILAALGSEHCTLTPGEISHVCGIFTIIAFVISYIVLLASWSKEPEELPSVVTASVLGYGITTAYSFITGPWHNDVSRFSYQFSGLYLGVLIESATGVCDKLSSAMAKSSSTSEPILQQKAA